MAELQASAWRLYRHLHVILHHEDDSVRTKYQTNKCVKMGIGNVHDEPIVLVLHGTKMVMQVPLHNTAHEISIERLAMGRFSLTQYIYFAALVSSRV